MKKEEAIILVKNKYKNRVIDKITETDKYFIISFGVKNTSPDLMIDISYDDGLVAVDKKTKEIFTYHPLIHGRG